jgi:hypothetical protein
MFAAFKRPIEDRNRHLVDFIRPNEESDNHSSDETYFVPAWGTPFGEASEMAYDQDRYGGLNSDPLFQLGLDTRIAYWSASESVFPMQFDTQASLHPIPYFTAYVNSGVLAKAKGFAGTAQRRPVYGVKDAFVMLHQLPYMMYVRAGRFIPQFGTRLEDHTSPTRRDFELGPELLNSRVTGAEFGVTPNYPFFNISVFRPGHRDQFEDGSRVTRMAGVNGTGMAASTGWRDVGGSIGVSYMMRNRDLPDGGNTRSASLFGSFNPWFWIGNALPLTYMGEISVGNYQRSVSGSMAHHIAMFHELDYLIFNGINLRFKYDYSDYDRSIKNDHSHRYSLGVDWTLFPGLMLMAQARHTNPAGTDSSDEDHNDLLMQLRAWL